MINMIYIGIGIHKIIYNLCCIHSLIREIVALA